MADLVISGGAGVVSLRVLRGSWVEKEGKYLGGRAYNADGDIITSETAYGSGGSRRRIITCNVDLPTYDDEVELRQICPRGAEVTIEGDLPVLSFPALVDIGDVTALYDEQNGLPVYLRAATLTISQTGSF